MGHHQDRVTARNRTKSDSAAKITTEGNELTTKRLKAIPQIPTARTYEAGCKAAGISKTTFYAWMRDEAFRTAFERQRDELVEAAFAMIAQNLGKAVSTLVGLLEATDDRVRRLTANDHQYLPKAQGVEGIRGAHRGHRRQTGDAR